MLMKISIAVLLMVSCATATPQEEAAAPSAVARPRVVPSRPTRPPRDEADTKEAAQPLYSRLGGQDAITAVVDDFLARVSKDERINGRFSNADIPHLRGMLIEFFCEATGGPCKYSGKDMKTAHAGMGIVEAEFTALVQNLKGALDHLNVPAREQKDVLGALGPLKPQIVVPVAAMADVPTDEGAEGSAGEPRATEPEGRASRPDPVLDRARTLRQVSALLEKANAARLQGSRSYADQLFSSAEVIVGTQAVADLAPLFRQGAPPRIVSSLKAVSTDVPAQPPAVGNSDDEQPEKTGKRKRGQLMGTVVSSSGRALPSLAIVTLEPLSGKFSRRVPKQRVIEQRDREFAPKVLAIPVGSTVSFPNFDPVYHNVFSRSATRPFDLGIYKAGQSRELVFSKEGVVRIGCNLHANMSAYVAVVGAPHYAVADTAGQFSFRSLAPGRYRLRAWTENSDTPSVQTIAIKTNENHVVVTLSTDKPVGLQNDKFGAPRGGPTEE